MNDKLSIITVTYNCSSTIEQTICSLVKAKKLYGTRLELIFVDGQSVDGTCKIIEKYLDVISKYISEIDNGIYSAMNKGIDLATGDWILFINDGDLLLDVRNIFSALDTNRNVDLIVFPVLLSDKSVFYPTFDWRIKIHNTLHHQGVCYHKKILSYYDEKYMVFSDFDLNQRIFLKKIRVIVENKVVTSHSLEGISHNKKFAKEIFYVINKNFGILFVSISYCYFKYKGFIWRIKKLFF